MLMPVLEYSYNRHIAKIPNCKMRRMTPKAASMRMLLPLLLLQLLLLPCQAVDPAASGGGGATGGVGAAAGAVAGSNSLNGGPAGGTLSANLTELGSPGVYNSTNGYNANCNIWRICNRPQSPVPNPPDDAAILAFVFVYFLVRISGFRFRLARAAGNGLCWWQKLLATWR
ncbi:uncharacterized protein DMAD_12137 [Drosophila madeirensis]|uniref:Uncharacterized protein n=1 Tax=Drosophila madeirensis TaxID=30013 RepID=A0AAU9FFQ6_DROMD